MLMSERPEVVAHEVEASVEELREALGKFKWANKAQKKKLGGQGTDMVTLLTRAVLTGLPKAFKTRLEAKIQALEGGGDLNQQDAEDDVVEPAGMNVPMPSVNWIH
jgi:hypothetical protein